MDLAFKLFAEKDEHGKTQQQLAFMREQLRDRTPPRTMPVTAPAVGNYNGLKPQATPTDPERVILEQQEKQIASLAAELRNAKHSRDQEQDKAHLLETITDNYREYIKMNCEVEEKKPQ